MDNRGARGFNLFPALSTGRSLMSANFNTLVFGMFGPIGVKDNSSLCSCSSLICVNEGHWTNNNPCACFGMGFDCPFNGSNENLSHNP